MINKRFDNGSDKNKKARASHDSAWKDVIDQYLPNAVQLCFPDFYELVDWSKGWINLDKELQAMTKNSQTGTRYVDKLISLYLKTGEKTRVLLHLELEQNPKAEFPERMFIYSSRSYDRHRCPIYSCAILTDSNKNFRTNYFNAGIGSSTLRIEFPLCKLIDFETKRGELELSTDPFAVVILYHLDALLAKKQQPSERLQTKIALTKRLYKKGFSKESIINLYRFLDFSIALPKGLELEYEKEIHKIDEEEESMVYLSNIERRSIERGLQKGIQQGLQQGLQQGMQQGIEQIAIRMLRENMDLKLISKITGLTLDKLKELKVSIEQ